MAQYKTQAENILRFLRQNGKLHWKDNGRVSYQDRKITDSNTIIGKSDRISNISDEFLINDNIVSDKTFITNAFNNYFLNVGKTLSKIIVSTGDALSYVNSNLTTIFVPNIQEIEKLNVMSLLNNSTAGCDDLQPSIMKMLTKIYIKPLTYLINISIKQGIFRKNLSCHGDSDL